MFSPSAWFRARERHAELSIVLGSGSGYWLIWARWGSREDSEPGTCD